jgi:predicted permease
MAPHRRLRPSGALVVVEIAATMVLVTGAALLINSYAHLMRVSPGLDPNGALTFQLALSSRRYTSPTVQQQTVVDVLQRIRTLPAVSSAAATGLTLDGAPVAPSPIVIDGRPVRGGIRYRFITPDYFRALGIPMRLGREFREGNTGAAAEAVVNEAFVRRHLEGRNVESVTLAYGDRTPMRIAGVAADSKLRLDEDPPPTLYLPADARAFLGLSTFIVRSTAEPHVLLPPVREIVRGLDPRLAIHNAMTIDEMMTHAATSPRMYGMLAFWCSLVALLLSGTGLYGVLAYWVGTRTQELGIRMALGASATTLTAVVVRQGLMLTAVGVAAGLAASVYATRFLDTLLFDLTPHDPTTFAATVAVFVVVALAASYVPSRRATRVDPVVALRAE